MYTVDYWGFKIRSEKCLPDGTEGKSYVDFMGKTYSFYRYSDAVQFIDEILGRD